MAIPIPEKSRRSYSSSSSTCVLKTPPLLSPMAQRSFHSYLPRPVSPTRQSSLELPSSTKPQAPNTAICDTTPDLMERLRLDRDHWRTRAVSQDSQILSLTQRLGTAQRSISILISEKIALQTQVNAADATAKTLADNIAVVEMKNKTLEQNHKALGQNLKDAENRIAKLRKSDRAKEKVNQRNLRMKALVTSHRCGGNGGPVGRSREEGLLEALSVALDRVDELEKAGEKLLDAIEQSDDSSDEEENDEKIDGVVAAEIKLGGLLEDDTFRELSKMWRMMLEDAEK